MALMDRLSPRARQRLEQTVFGLGMVALFVFLAGSVFFLRIEREARLPPTPPNERGPTPLAPAGEPMVFGDPLPFQAAESDSGARLDRGAAHRFRLVGTFLDGSAPAKGARDRLAILEELENRRQHLASEGDTVGDLRVLRIERDGIMVHLEGRDERLPLAFPLPAEAGKAVVSAADPDAGEGEFLRYGRRVGETRWVLERDALLAYYHEMLEDPIRIARLYRSFDPVRNEQGSIDGYRLHIRGERDFLSEVGLREADHIRAVNSLPMTRQSRAEYFLGEFVRDDLDIVVLDVEREGERRKLIYMMR